MKIDNKSIAFELNGSFTANKIINKKTNDNYIKMGLPIPFFYLNGFSGETWQRLDPVVVAEETDGEHAVVCVQFGDRKIFGIVSFDFKEEEQLSVKIKIVNEQTDFRVCETVGPNLYGLRLGNEYKKNVFIYPHHAGEKTVNPMDRYRDQDYKDFFRAYTRETDYNTLKRAINYCGLASMSFMYLYDANNGLYFGSHDMTFPVTTLTAEVGTEKRFMGLSFTKHYDFGCGETYASGEYVLGVNCKDWHEARKIYRPYLLPKLKFHNYPDYLDDQFGLNQCYNFKRQGEPVDNCFANIPAMYERGKKLNLNHMFMASWNRGGFDTDYPEYYPDMDLGTGMDFVRGLKYIKDHGGIPTLYINARIFDREGLYFETVGKRMAMTDHEHNDYVETYGTKSFTISCPSDEEWQHRLTDIVEYLVYSYGATGVYLDQLGSAEPFACYHEGHTHKHIGDFNNGYLRVLSDVHDRIQGYDKNTFILTENIGDIYASYTFGNLTWNGPEFDEYYNVIKYIFPEFPQINMVNPRIDKEGETHQRDLFYKRMERAILLGSILWYAPTVKKPDSVAYQVKYCEQSCAFRESIQPIIKKSTYKDDIYVKSLGEGIVASIFENEDEMLLLVGNVGETENKAVFDLPFIPSKVQAFDFMLNDVSEHALLERNRLSYSHKSKLSKIIITK